MNQTEPSVPKYRQISGELGHDIVAGRYQPGQKFPSEAALVKRFGASRITIGHALRELQQRGLIDRVAGSGTFIRKPAGQRPQGLVFGLVIPNLGESEIFEPICQAIAASPDAEGQALLWAHADSRSSDKDEQALQLCRQCIAHKVSGVFFAPLEMTAQSAEVNHRVMKLLGDAGIPVVLLDRRPDDAASGAGQAGRRSDLVGIDNHRAGYLAASHLIRLGAQRTGFVAYQNQASTVKTRIVGYLDALTASGGPEARPRVFHLEPARQLQLPPAALECDAFVCAHDRLAGHVMHTLMSRGIAIPQDVRIAGIDDVHYAALLPVPLTTVHQPCQDIGESALRAMLDRLERPKMPARDILLDCELVIRQSCGAARPQ